MTVTKKIPDKHKKYFPETVHFDQTARVQTVSESDGSEFSELLKSVRKISGHGSVINTSFNLSGEPIVETPTDALRTYFSSGIDVLYLGDYKLKKSR